MDDGLNMHVLDNRVGKSNIGIPKSDRFVFFFFDLTVVGDGCVERPICLVKMNGTDIGHKTKMMAHVMNKLIVIELYKEYIIYFFTCG